jgi:hypothetical protein
MAEKKTATKTEKTTAAKAAKPAAAAGTVSAKAPTRTPATPPAGPDDVKCRAPKCKQAARAKGYCRKHYMGWRRGDVGAKHRYKICSKEACRKPSLPGGRCAEHKKGVEAAPAA